MSDLQSLIKRIILWWSNFFKIESSRCKDLYRCALDILDLSYVFIATCVLFRLCVARRTTAWAPLPNTLPRSYFRSTSWPIARFSLRFSRALYGLARARARDPVMKGDLPERSRGSFTFGDLPRFNSSILLQRFIQLAEVIAPLLVRNVVVGDLTVI